LAGAINTTHDLLGMLIRTRGEEDTIADDNLPENEEYLKDLPHAYVYYYPAEYKYCRRGVTYDWDTRDFTSYDPATWTSSTFYKPVAASAHLDGWPSPNVHYFYREKCEGWSTEVNNTIVHKYNYVLE
jgi:hypothetical protein